MSLSWEADGMMLYSSNPASVRARAMREALRVIGWVTLISWRTIEVVTENGVGLRVDRVSCTVATQDGQCRLSTRKVVNLD
jgi:hypothetical protein